MASEFRKRGFLRLLKKAVETYREKGISYTLLRVKYKIMPPDGSKKYNIKHYSIFKLNAQRKAVFDKKIKFSIIVPLYNTNEAFLHEMIKSVLKQTYGDFELCLADGSDKENNIEKICLSYAAKDKRIKYKKLEKNLGISGNTNAALDMASGNYISLLDHDDILRPAALYESAKAICEKNADMIYTDEATFISPDTKHIFCANHKPDFSPDTLRSYNYICHFLSFSRELMEKAGHFRSEFDGSQDYDMVLRLSEKAQNIVHIPIVLYYWRSHSESVASSIDAKPYTILAAKKALSEHLQRIGLCGEVMDGIFPSTYKIKYKIEGRPLVSILIPNKDHIEDLSKCIDSLLSKTDYDNFEIIIIENNSTEEKTFEYYKKLSDIPKIKIIYWKDKFNYSAINNFGVKSASGEYILLLNNDIEVINPDWLENMLMFCQRGDVGAVGAMLYYPDDTVQHAGVIIGIGGNAGHSHKHYQRGEAGYSFRMAVAQNYSAVTAACLLTKKKIWDEVGGLDEGYAVAFNDVDLCLKMREKGYLCVWTPFAEFYHYESKSRGNEDTPEKLMRAQQEVDRFRARWKKLLDAGDPFYNPNLSLDREDFSAK